jgi:hypothetical protein
MRRVHAAIKRTTRAAGALVCHDSEAGSHELDLVRPLGDDTRGRYDPRRRSVQYP